MRAELLLSPVRLLVAFNYIAFLPVVASQAAAPSPTQPSIIEQPILHPSKSDVLIPGGTFTIQWTPNSAFSNVSLEIWDKTSWGYSRDFGDLCYHWVNPFCGTIVSDAPNTGSYVWNIPNPADGFPRGDRVFWIKMYVDDYLQPSIGNSNPVLSYSQNFAFALDQGQNASASAGTSASGDGATATDVSMVTVTVYANPSTTGGPVVSTSAFAPASVTSSTGQGKNDTMATPSQGMASKLTRALPVGLLFLLGLL